MDDSSEVARLQRQVERLGHKVLRMQLQVESANRGRRRAEALLRVLSEIYTAAEREQCLGAWADQFARSLVDMVRASRAVLLERAESGEVRSLATLGFGGVELLLPSEVDALPWGERVAFVDGNEALAGPLRFMGQRRVLWVNEATTNLAVILSADVGGLRLSQLAPDSGLIVEPALRVFGLLRARQAEAAALEAARAEAQNASHAKSRFLANMSHEIRTPMSGVLGVAEELLEWDLEAPIRERVRTIQDSGRVLLTVLNDILDFSKVEAGRLELDLQPVDLPRLLAELEMLFGPQARLRGLSLKRSDGSIPRWIEADPVRLRQVLSNLIGNAVKFTKEGYIELTSEWRPTSSEEGRLILSVRDTGVGMSKAAQRRVFEPFMQAADAPDRSHQGTGLGLAICSELIGLMQGQLSLETMTGQGSTFTVDIPTRSLVAPESAQGPEPIEVRELVAPGLRVLLAEDDRTNQLVSRRLLERMGHQVVVVEDGFAAVHEANASRFDVVLMDVQMPGCDGLRATQILRSGPRDSNGARVPIIALTAHAMASHRRDCLDAGMNGHVTKPVVREHLEVEIARVLGARGRVDTGSSSAPAES